MFKQLSSRILAAAFFGLVVSYAFLAMDVSRLLGSSWVDDEQRQGIVSKFEADLGQDMGEQNWATRVNETGLLLSTTSELTGSEYAYGEESSYDVFVGYLKLPLLNQFFLVIHTGTAGLALGLMCFLLVPALRRRWFRYHKIIGRSTASILAVSMVTATGYLTTTPEELVFADKAFYVGLWILAALTSGSLIAAIVAIKNGQRARHQAFMHLCFAAMLTAPLLRLDWQIIWLFSDAASFTQNQYLAEIVLLPQCLVIGYLFFIWARRANPMPSASPTLTATNQYSGFSKALVFPAALGFGFFSLFYLDLELLNYLSVPFLTDVTDHPAAVRAAGISIAQNHSLLFSVQRLLMVATALLAITLLARQWLKGLTVTQTPVLGRWVLTITLLVSGLLALWAGQQMGSPSHELRSAGGYLIIYGLIAITLFGLKLWSAVSDNIEIEREAHWLTLGLAITPAQFSISWLMETLIGSPAIDAYAMGAGNAAMGLLVPLIWVLWSQQDSPRRVY